MDVCLIVLKNVKPVTYLFFKKKKTSLTPCLGTYEQFLLSMPVYQTCHPYIKYHDLSKARKDHNGVIFKE